MGGGTAFALAHFEKAGIDYRCGGKRSLRAAALEAGCDPDALLAELDAQAIEEGDRDWRHARDQAGLAEA